MARPPAQMPIPAGLKSMTGFARTDGAVGQFSWAWEVRSVNGRNLDVRLRLAPGLDVLEPRVREAVANRFQRGSLQISLTTKRDEGGTIVRLNEIVLGQVIAAATRVRELTGAPPPSVEGLLAQRGVLEIGEPAEVEGAADARTSALLASFDQALDGAVRARAAEGERLRIVLLDQVAEIERLTALIATDPSRSVEAQRCRLAEQVARLLDASQSFDAARLHQEAVMAAARADVEEELKRLAAHTAAARDLLASHTAVGRKLDFLAQEFNREANTICSKANDIAVTSAGMLLKVVIDQFREQVQNIE